MAPTAEEHAERVRLRALLMHNTAELWLVTVDGSRWLTDKYTLLQVTDSPTLRSDDEAHSWGQLPDGAYSLTLIRGLEPSTKDHVAPEAEKLLRAIEDERPRWLPCTETQWSIAESGAKAMLTYALDDDGERWPVLINEEVWTAYHDQYDRNPKVSARVLFEKDPARPGRPYRITLVEQSTFRLSDDTEEIELEERKTLAYVMPAKMPTAKWGKHDATAVAQYIVNEAA